VNKSSGRPKAHTTTISAVADGRFESNSEVRARNWAVCFTPQEQTSSARPVWSEKCQKQTHGLQQNQHSYSITASARVSTVGGTVMPSTFAVFRLITSSYLVGCSTGRSAGFAPLKILSTKTADRR
jgi:hypothetical protein